MEESNQYDH